MDNKIMLRELSAIREEVALKHQINILTAVLSQLEHLILYVVEAPTLKAVERYLRDTDFAFYNKIEIKEVEPMEEALKIL